MDQYCIERGKKQKRCIVPDIKCISHFYCLQSYFGFSCLLALKEAKKSYWATTIHVHRGGGEVGTPSDGSFLTPPHGKFPKSSRPFFFSFFFYIPPLWRKNRAHVWPQHCIRFTTAYFIGMNIAKPLSSLLMSNF